MSDIEIAAARLSVLAWDPDFVKVTDEERMLIDAAEKSGFIDDKDIDWSNIGTDE